MNYLFTVGLEIHAHPEKTVRRGDEMIHISAANHVIARFLGDDLRMHTAMTGAAFKEGMDPTPALRQALATYPIDGRRIAAVPAKRGARALSRAPGQGKEREGHLLRPAKMSAPERKADKGEVRGKISGWGIAVEAFWNKWFLSPYLAIQTTRQLQDKEVPATAHARFFPIAHPDTLLCGEDWLFYGPDAEEGDIPSLFHEMQDKHPLGSIIHAVACFGSGQVPGYHYFQNTENELGELKALDLTQHGRPSA
jgi:hypothetical protein